MRLAYRKRYYFTHPRSLIHAVWLPIYSFYQRGTRGWADSDAWNTDDYLATVIPQMLSYLADHAHGVPGGVWKDGREAWNTYLREVAQAFIDYKAITESDEVYNPEAYTETLNRMRKVFEYYLYLWD